MVSFLNTKIKTLSCEKKEEKMNSKLHKKTNKQTDNDTTPRNTLEGSQRVFVNHYISPKTTKKFKTIPYCLLKKSRKKKKEKHKSKHGNKTQNTQKNKHNAKYTYRFCSVCLCREEIFLNERTSQPGSSSAPGDRQMAARTTQPPRKRYSSTALSRI